MFAYSRHTVASSHLHSERLTHQRHWRGREMVAREGDHPEYLIVITQGWAARLRTLSAGIRQITGIYLPGDVCDFFWMENNPVAQPVTAITELRGIAAPIDAIRFRAERDPSFKDALWQESQWRAEAACEWMVNLSRRDATTRLAHIFCEFLTRQQAAGLASGNCCDMPLTQYDLADLAGITPIHTNRTLQWLRSKGLVELRSRRLRVLDLDSLKNLAGFNERYLATEQIRRAGRLILSEGAQGKSTPDDRSASAAA